MCRQETVRTQNFIQITIECPTRFSTLICRYSKAAIKYFFFLEGVPASAPPAAPSRSPVVAWVQRTSNAKFSSLGDRRATSTNLNNIHSRFPHFFDLHRLSFSPLKRHPLSSPFVLPKVTTHLPFKNPPHLTDALHTQRAGCEPPSWTSTLCS